jgi:hypothetical protein
MNVRNVNCLVLCIALASAYALAAGDRKEFKYTVGHDATVNIMNQFGSVNLTPATGNQGRQDRLRDPSP